MTKSEKLTRLNSKMSSCSGCALCTGASHVVFGSGNPNAQIMFIGEAPGKKENETGLPFVGSSGKILDKMLSSINLSRDDVYITNVCKCRPPENRDPQPEEISECLPWLKKQIDIIKPKLVITLGGFALSAFLTEAKISEVHGKIVRVKISSTSTINILPFYHPAAARISKKTRALFEEDFKNITKILQQIMKNY